ncbi:hypothetical protein RchiOBHm_Chr4g0404901 [Rosa chinensis]|uniref:Uncharacterized protein n=1 Tax=Rosa chinensis TaxID=74649 RepID=A0A2P6QTX6_ROSCH|nr:hypothetical protein RchiOBHm_Chr4g0404901 [Rosa chinensis]
MSSPIYITSLAPYKQTLVLFNSMPPVFSFSSPNSLVKYDLLSPEKSLPISWIKYHKWRMKEKQQQLQPVKLIFI